nr:hypothetical protein Iba_chr04bCG16740 [Ipomoea batatas]
MKYKVVSLLGFLSSDRPRWQQYPPFAASGFSSAILVDSLSWRNLQEAIFKMNPETNTDGDCCFALNKWVGVSLLDSRSMDFLTGRAFQRHGLRVLRHPYVYWRSGLRGHGLLFIATSVCCFPSHGSYLRAATTANGYIILQTNPRFLSLFSSALYDGKYLVYECGKFLDNPP